MDSTGLAIDQGTETERQRRRAWEAGRIAEARAGAAAGRIVRSPAMKAWIDSLATDHKLPVPCARP